MSIFGDWLHDGERLAGDTINGGARLLGDGLNAVGLHGAATAVDTEGARLGYDLGADVPKAQLGQTTDPGELVHGDAPAIHEATSKLRVFAFAFASGFGEVADGLRRIDTGHWEGAATDAFQARFAMQPARWSEAAAAMGKAASANIRCPGNQIETGNPVPVEVYGPGGGDLGALLASSAPKCVRYARFQGALSAISAVDAGFRQAGRPALCARSSLPAAGGVRGGRPHSWRPSSAVARALRSKTVSGQESRPIDRRNSARPSTFRSCSNRTRLPGVRIRACIMAGLPSRLTRRRPFSV
jgi:hypothetical protein